MKNWSRELWERFGTSAVWLWQTSQHESQHVDLGDLATQIKSDCRRFWMCAKLSLHTWQQSLSSLSMGTVNQYKLITWLDPLGTKTSSINHASTFQAAVPLQPSVLPSKNEKRVEGWGHKYVLTGVSVCWCMRLVEEEKQRFVIVFYVNTKVAITIATQDGLLNPDHKRTDTVSHLSDC